MKKDKVKKEGDTTGLGELFAVKHVLSLAYLGKQQELRAAKSRVQSDKEPRRWK